MKQRGKFVVISAIFLFIIMIVAGVVIYKTFAPSKKEMKLEEYYHSTDQDAVLILQDEIYSEKGKVLDNQVYIDYETVKQYFNSRFYWDRNEQLFIYTTPTEVIKSKIGSDEYSINGKTEKAPGKITWEDSKMLYISLDFIKAYSDIEYTRYQNPERVVIQYIWNTDFLFSKVKKATQVRLLPDIKSSIVKQVKKGDILQIIVDEEEIHKKFSKVITQDGVIGYVKNKAIGKAYYEKKESTFKSKEYTNIAKDYKINLVFHQVTNQTANNNVLALLERTKNVTTVSPTWFKVKNVEGEVDSLASETYVERIHNMGLEVWGLVDDFTYGVDMKELLSYTSRREKLANEIVSLALQYKLDGINLDFEKIPKASGEDYTQFLREISILCRKNQIVLSVDNYVPSVYTTHYNRKEQGILVDYVITMAYDEHITSEDGSGSVASIGFVKDAIKNVLEEVPREKNIIAIPFYTRMWEESDGKVRSRAYSMEQALSILKENGVTPQWDAQTQQLYGEYKKNGVVYKIWLEEERSIEEKLKAITKNDVAGIACWKLGLEKRDIWDVIATYIK